MDLVIDRFSDEFTFLEYSFYYKAGLIYHPGRDSEALCMAVMEKLTGREKILEIGTGSGCIAITIKKNFPESYVVAADISQDSIDCTAQNMAKNRQDLDLLVISDMLSGIQKLPFDVMVGCLPFMSSAEYDSMTEEKKEESRPRNAFDAGASKYHCFDRIAICKEWLSVGGKLFLVVPGNMLDEVNRIYTESGFSITGSDRVGELQSYIVEYRRDQ